MPTDAATSIELAAILRNTSGLADLVAESLAPLSNEIDLAFIFGSVARGAETANSDVDLLIVGATSFGAVAEALHPVQQRLSREINPKIFTAREWIAKRKQKNPFVLEVVGKPKIFLLGTENHLTELGRHNP